MIELLFEIPSYEFLFPTHNFKKQIGEHIQTFQFDTFYKGSGKYKWLNSVKNKKIKKKQRNQFFGKTQFCFQVSLRMFVKIFMGVYSANLFLHYIFVIQLIYLKNT